MTRARRVRTGRPLFWFSLVASFALGCHEPTEIVVVVDTDLTLGKDFDQIEFTFTGGFQTQVASAVHVPATLGVLPPDTNGEVTRRNGWEDKAAPSCRSLSRPRASRLAFPSS